MYIGNTMTVISKQSFTHFGMATVMYSFLVKQTPRISLQAKKIIIIIACT